MKKSTFHSIWEQTVKLVIDSMDIQIHNRFKKYDIDRRNLGKIERKVYKSYQKNRKYLKTYLYNSKKTRNNDESVLDNTNSLIDYHKMASCLCKALIENKVYKFDYEPSLPVEIQLLNYKVAYLSSVAFIKYYMLIAYNFMDKQLYEKFKVWEKLEEPKTSTNHSYYNDGRVKVIAQSDIYNKEFDLLMFADTLYWIEVYNRQILEEKIILEPLEFPQSEDDKAAE